MTRVVLSLFHSNAFCPCASVFGTEPDMIRDGSTIPIARIFQDTVQKSVMMLPLGAVDDGEHAQNEKINRSVDSWGGGLSFTAQTPGLHIVTSPRAPYLRLNSHHQIFLFTL